MEFLLGSYISKDLKRIGVQSAKEDIENHYKIFRGRVKEIGSPYSVPLANFLYQTTVDGTTVSFFKDRCATTKPMLSPSKGMRIIFAHFVIDKKPVKYIPFIVFLAKEEGAKYRAPNGKKYPLTSSYFKYIIESKLECL